MREIESPYTAGTVGVVIGSLARYRALFTSLEMLKVPKGTALVYAEGADIQQNCNTLVDGITGEWLWIMGDDHRFKPDVLMNLLAHKVDMVAPMVCKRGPTFKPVCYRIADVGNPHNELHTWETLQKDFPQGGLAQVDAVGSAGLLVKRQVFAATPKPWFEFTRYASEDINFCLSARKSGFKVHIDLDQTMTHITPVDLEPFRRPSGQWIITAAIGDRRVPFVESNIP